MFGLTAILTSLYMVIIFIVSLLGNLTTMIAIWTYDELQTTTHYYILNLAIADFLMSLATPVKILLIIHHEDYLCRVNVFLAVLFFFASVLAICLIAVDRYVFICKPLYYRTHPISTKNHVWIILSWIFALLISVIPIASFKGNPNKNIKICKYSTYMPRYYLAFLIIVTELLPPLVFVVMYGRIIAVARRHAIEIAIQLTNSKPFTMDWLQRRKLTESLISPFENPSYLLDKVVGNDDSEEAKAIRQILYKNYNSWRLKQAELRKQSQKEEHLEEEDEVFDSEGKETAENDLSRVGRGLHKWKVKALSVTTAPNIGDLIVVVPNERRQASQSSVSSACVSKSKSTSVTTIDNINNDDDDGKKSTTDRGQTAVGLRQRLVEYCSSKISLNMTEDGDKRWRVTRSILTAFSKQNQERKKQIRIKKEFKAIKMLGLVVGMFIALNIPIGIIDMLEMSQTGLKIPGWTVKLALCLAYSNPAVNPMIYVITRRQFRSAYLRLWSCGRHQPRFSERSY